MIFSSRPVSLLAGETFLPASKSYSIRAFLIAACGGRSRILYPSNCDDAKVAIRAAKSLGAKIRCSSPGVWIVDAGKIRPVKKIDVGESGTVLRFVLPLLALSGQKVCVTGKGTLRGRPNRPLTGLLRRYGVLVRGKGAVESIPIEIFGGKMLPGQMEIAGSLSSQFISALLIACPQLEKDTHLRITGKKMVSGDYIEMTNQVLRQSRVKVLRKSQREFFVPGRQTFKGLKHFTVPADFGLAAFLMAAASLVPAKIVLRGCLRQDLIQADGRIFDVLKKMGVKFQKTKKFIRIKSPVQLKGGNFSLLTAPDLVPVVCVLALFAKGKTRIYDIRHARAKESDRISDLRQELLKIGAKITEKEDELIIDPQPEYKANVLLDPHQDHRLAMAFSVLGAKIGTRVKNIECVSKSYPDFLKDFKELGGRGSLA